uniref:HDGE_amylase domain-containing protein n=1 Tax=Heterorhabditis bacteriophora TaxID=37862 RepID=A0A1I7X3W8_HETBA
MRRSKWDRRGSTPRPPHPTPRRLPQDHDSTCRVVYFGWQLLRSIRSNEFGKKKEKEMETPPGHGEELILRCFPDFVDCSPSAKNKGDWMKKLTVEMRTLLMNLLNIEAKVMKVN